MLEIEQAHHYLSAGSENEYVYVLNMLNGVDPSKNDADKLKLLELTGATVYVGSSKVEFQIRTIKNSVHAYWLQLINRFLAQFHMWLLHNFVVEFKDSFHRQIDQEFAPNSGTELGEDVKAWMEDPFVVRNMRKDLTLQIDNLKTSLQDLDNVNKRTF